MLTLHLLRSRGNNAVRAIRPHTTLSIKPSSQKKPLPKRMGLSQPLGKTAIKQRYSILSRSCSALDAPIAVSTFLTSSGGGSTAGNPRASIHNSRVHPIVW